MNKICYVVTLPETIKAFFVPQLRFLSNNGYDVTVVCSSSNDIQKVLGASIRFIPIKMVRGISLLESIRATWALVKLFKQERFDLIQYSTPNAALYSSIAARVTGCKIRNYHLMGFRFLTSQGLQKIFLKTIEKITCWNSTSIECVSESNMIMGIQEKLFDEEKAVVVWNGSTGGVDLKRFDYRKREQWRKEIRNELGYGDCDFLFGFIGRITKDKGINEILEAFSMLENNSKLLFVGPMEGKETLCEDLLQKAYSNPNILFHNPVRDVERYFAAIDVLVLPSYREGFGNVVIEAAAMGTPSIITNIPGPIDAIDEGKTALTVRVGDAGDLASKMKKMCEMDYQKMGQSAVLFCESNFSEEVLCQKILERKKSLLR